MCVLLWNGERHRWRQDDSMWVIKNIILWGALPPTRKMMFKRQECVFLSLLVKFTLVKILQSFFFISFTSWPFFVYCKRHLTNKQRYKVVRVGGWERTLSFPFQLRERAELVVWGYLLSLTMSLTMPRGCPSFSDAAESCVALDSAHFFAPDCLPSMI